MLDFPTSEEIKRSCRSLPLFPLPQVVFFPNTLLRLHVFEPRYVQLLTDCLSKDRIMVIPRLAPDWKEGGDSPPIYPIAGMGFVLHSEKQADDDRYNIVLLGLGRVRIQEEHPSDRMYRTARADLLEDVLSSEAVWQSKLHSLKVLLSQLTIYNPELSGVLNPLLTTDCTPSQFLNTLAHLVHQDVDQRQRFLEENDIINKAELVEEALSLVLLKGQGIEE